jgi:hypothetical protein
MGEEMDFDAEFADLYFAGQFFLQEYICTYMYLESKME